MTTAPTMPAPETDEPRRRGPNTVVVAILAVVAVAAAVFGVAVLVHHNNSSPGAGDTVFTSMRQGCAEWQSTTGMHGTDGPWCDAMTTWMQTQVRTGMMPMAMMAGDVASMRDACRQWAAQDGASSDATHCDDMFEWMQQHDGAWSSWMHGSAMGTRG
jgi:hypothetical protein